MPDKLPHGVPNLFKINFFDQFLFGYFTGAIESGKTDQEAAEMFNKRFGFSEDNCSCESLKNRYYKIRVMYAGKKWELKCD